MSTTTQIKLDDFIKAKIEHIKQVNEKLNLDISDSNTLIQTDILAIVNFLENMYIKNGVEDMISGICNQTIEILEGHNLAKHTSLAYKVIPDKFKDPNKNGFKNLESKIVFARLNRNLSDINALDLDKLDNSSVRSAYDEAMALTTKFSEQMSQRNLSTIGDDSLSRLKEAEKARFKKAAIGQPLTTVEEMCQNPDYAESFEQLIIYFDQLIDTWKTMKVKFTQEYIPISVEACRETVEAIKWLVDFVKPFTDGKYRRDHYQMIQMAILKVSETATKASKESRLPCGHHFDKKGNPLFRRITKEQIDSMYESEFNFILHSFNMMFRWYELLSNMATDHYYRCKEDRAVDLSGTLSHHA